MSVVDRISFNSKKAKGHACRHLEMIGECINLALYVRVVIEYVTVEVTELKGIPLQGGALKRCSNVGFDKNSILESNKALKMLHKHNDVPIVYVLFY